MIVHHCLSRYLPSLLFRVSTFIMVNHPTVTHVPTQATKHELLGIWSKYQLLDYVLMCLSVENERIDTRPPRWVSFYPLMFWNGDWLSLYLFTQSFMSHAGVAPTQLAPNTWRTIMALAIPLLELGNGEGIR